ncbi:hypothetical protein PQX77_007320 [Marasmius sp. AFHP31]|nr:hypothetical protein PQX77_007320 [Marasmius sp. AFHP31]
MDLTSSKFSADPTRIVVLDWSAVCRRWRIICLSTPSLWSKLQLTCVDDSWDDEERGKKVHRTVCMFMNRSQNHPLSIILLFTHPPQSSGLHNVIETLLRDSGRWESFTTYSWSAITFHPAFQSVKNTFSALRSLSVMNQVDGNTVIQDLGRTPALRYLYISFTRFPTSEVQTLFATQLGSVDIRLAGGTPVSARKLASLCAFIQKLSLRIREGQLVDEAPHHCSSIASELKCLRLDFDPGASSLFLHSIAAPRLSSVDLSSSGTPLHALVTGSYSPWDPSPFISFVKRSSCTITSLSLCNITLGSDQQVAQFLSCMPAVKSLIIAELLRGREDEWWTNVTQTTSRLLQELCVGHNEEPVREAVRDIAQGGESFSSTASTRGPLLPSLINFHLDISRSLNDANTSTLMKLVASRWTTDVEDRARAGLVESFRLVEIKCDSRRDIPESLKSQLRSLSDAGLEVFLIYMEDY